MSVNSPLSIERHCGGVGSGCSSSTTRRSRFERAPCDNDVDDDHDPVLLLLLLQTTIQKKLKETPFLSFCLFSLKFSPSSLPRIAFFFSLSLFLFLQSPWPIEKRRLDDAGSRRSCARLARLFMAGKSVCFALLCFASAYSLLPATAAVENKAKAPICHRLFTNAARSLCCCAFETSRTSRES